MSLEGYERNACRVQKTVFSLKCSFRDVRPVFSLYCPFKNLRGKSLVCRRQYFLEMFLSRMKDECL